MTQDNEHYRAGFEAWARKEGYENLGGEYGGPGSVDWWYWGDETAAAWSGWQGAMQQREASTEPNADVDAWPLADALYNRGYRDAWKNRDQDARNCEEWQVVVDAIERAGAPPDYAKARYSAYVAKCQASGILPSSLDSFLRESEV